mmetsp:Transcript_139751/g.256449  ORF Transcript_139751/g.256449 Transcript_139751/m.256449 type:complete len:148 (-) Transcript_139751:134-577(-)
MGCSLCNAPRLPDGDGVSCLTWLPDDEVRRDAGMKNNYGEYVWFSKMLMNQEAIFNKVLGQPVASLPWLPVHMQSSSSGSYVQLSKQLMNQEAIFNKLLGQPLAALPWLPDEEVRRDAGMQNSWGSYVLFSKLIMNQEAIFNKLLGQ